MDSRTEKVSAADHAASTEPSPPTVVVDDLHVVYRVRRPSRRDVHALRGVSLVARRGESIGVIGDNGAGKSTLLRTIAGLLPPERGGVYASGHPCLLGVGAALMTDLTGARNIELGCLAMGMTPKELADHYDAIVEFAGLGKFIDMPMRAYSTGMAQRLRFAIATAMEHDVLLVDEALATGDAQFRRRCIRRMRELADRAGTVFLVSHHLDTIRTHCNRAIWLDQGTVRMDGDPAIVLAAYETATGP